MEKLLEIKFNQSGKPAFLTAKNNQEIIQIVAELERAGIRGITIEPPSLQPRPIRTEESIFSIRK